MPRTDEPTLHRARWNDESLDDALGESPTRPWRPDRTAGETLHDRIVPERFHGTRWDPGPRGVLILAAVGIFVVLLAATSSFTDRPAAHPVPPITPVAATDPNHRTTANNPGAQPETATTAPASTSARPSTAAEVVVSVVGLVEHGGLRRFPPGSRVADAIKAATPHPEADLAGLNLAQPLHDGDQIVIGRTDPNPATSQHGSTLTNAAQSAAIPAAPTESPAPQPLPPA
ncbi:hypothetical protein [Nocardia huaxiensis]|uniref:hypothetical protein n=1 Tax=Nocardia huaxiensis TaxID=2755382 RepID=UPI001E50732C|nr:hypothetical protein [Nocardia huaxiensis]UFS96240.1 hypothetical protein LPY97_37355 [Nocardia huaxiensis]